jgi:hypothetical protein
MRTLIAGVFLIGLLIGLGVGYEYSVYTPQKSWHYLTSFIVLDESGLAKAVSKTTPQSYPNMYDSLSPNFTVKGDFWQLELATVPYYYYSNRAVYYQQECEMYLYGLEVGVFGTLYRVITMTDPSNYILSERVVTETVNMSPNTYSFYCVRPGYSGDYTPVEVNYTYNEPGTYQVRMGLNNWGCFNFTISEYY